MKKLMSLLLVLIGSICFIFSSHHEIKADEGTPLSAYVKKLEDTIVRKSLDGGVLLDKKVVQTLQFGDLESDIWLTQTYQYVTMSSTSDAVSVVTWDKGKIDDWGSATVRETAHDFEEQNPGWIVVAAVNGDFVDLDNWQPLGTFVRDGDVHARDIVKSGLDQQVIGFISNREHIVGFPSSNDYLSLKLYEGDEMSYNQPLDAVNKLPSNNGISLFTIDFNGSVDLTDYTVYIGNYTTNRLSRQGRFVKGSITNIVNDLKTITSVPKDSFYLVTKNTNYESALEIGTKLKCEHEITGAFQGVNYTIGYNCKIIDNNQILWQGVTKSDNMFVGTGHPRTLVGFKEDGSVILMVVDGRAPGYQRNGVSLFEAGALLNVAGAVEGYNLDGGGSSTLLIRNEYGDFDVINTPSDGPERKIGNSILFVMQDPKIELTKKTDRTLEFKQLGPIAKGTIENVRIQLGGKSYPLVDGEVVIKNLAKDTLYYINYLYTIHNTDGTLTECTSKTYQIKTLNMEIPVINRFRSTGKINLGIKIDYEYRDNDNVVTSAYILYDDKSLALTSLKDTIEISNLTEGQDYEFQLYLQLGDGSTIVSDIIAFTPTKLSTGGCSMGMVNYIISMISLIFVGLMILRKKN